MEKVSAAGAEGGPSVPSVRAVGVSKSFAQGEAVVRALTDVDLEVGPGEFVAVTGRSGAGKSTLLYLLGGLDRPTAGEVLVGGVSLQGLSDDELSDLRRDRIGFVFQFFHLLANLSAEENVALPAMLAGAGKAAAHRRAAELLGTVGLGHRRDHRPRILSGGEMQRVAIARALVNEPDVLLADEPTGSLDSSTGSQILDLLAGAARDHGTPLVLVTHDEAVARRADRTVTLDDGRVLAPAARAARPRRPRQPRGARA